MNLPKFIKNRALTFTTMSHKGRVAVFSGVMIVEDNGAILVRCGAGNQAQIKTLRSNGRGLTLEGCTVISFR